MELNKRRRKTCQKKWKKHVRRQSEERKVHVQLFLCSASFFFFFYSAQHETRTWSQLPEKKKSQSKAKASTRSERGEKENIKLKNCASNYTKTISTHSSELGWVASVEEIVFSLFSCRIIRKKTQHKRLERAKTKLGLNCAWHGSNPILNCLMNQMEVQLVAVRQLWLLQVSIRHVETVPTFSAMNRSKETSCSAWKRWFHSFQAIT